MPGAEITMSGDYPGWKPNIDSKILVTMKETYNKLYGKVPEIKAIHAGLECGILKAKKPELEIISFGPTIRGAHSPEERVQVSSVARFWDALKEVLARLAAA